MHLRRRQSQQAGEFCITSAKNPAFDAKPRCCVVRSLRPGASHFAPPAAKDAAAPVPQVTELPKSQVHPAADK